MQQSGEKKRKRRKDTKSLFFLITSTWVFIFTGLILEAMRNPKWFCKSQIKVHIQSERQEFTALAWLYLMKMRKKIAIHSNILAWEIPRTEGPEGCIPWGLANPWTRPSD